MRQEQTGARVWRHEVGPLQGLEPIAVALAARLEQDRLDVHAAEDPATGGAEGVGAESSAPDRAEYGLAWLDSGRGATSGRSVLALGRRLALPDGAVLPALRSALQTIAVPETPDSALPLGLVGWFGYELRAETMGMTVPETPAHHRAAWLQVDRALLLDHATGTASLLALVDDDTEPVDGSAPVQGPAPVHDPQSGRTLAAVEAWRDDMLAVIATAPQSLADPPEPAPRIPRWRDSDEHYAAVVRRCQEAIHDGEAYQLCLTSAAEVDEPGDPLVLYRRVRRSSPAHHGAYLSIGGTALLSASPETFLHVAKGTVTTRPIKGTRRRDADPSADAALAAELAASEKEQAENLMIVDLMRNDLQRVCEVGTVTVTALTAVETYPHVHQLVSTIEGRMREGLDALDAVAACLPAGSMTGAPKRRAIELLAEWEVAPRGIYSGAFGMFGADGSADLAMVIRSIVVEAGRASVGAGGGITALSVPEEEVAEMHVKAAALLAALGSASSR